MKIVEHVVFIKFLYYLLLLVTMCTIRFGDMYIFCLFKEVVLNFIV